MAGRPASGSFSQLAGKWQNNILMILQIAARNGAAHKNSGLAGTGLSAGLWPPPVPGLENGSNLPPRAGVGGADCQRADSW